MSLLVGGTLLLVGFGGSLAFERFRIPDFIVLMGLGILLGHVPVAPFGPALLTSLEPILPVFTNLTIAFILFEGGLSLNLHGMGRRMPAVLVHVAASVTIVMLLLWEVSTRIFGLDDVTALVLAGAFCGPSASIVLGFIPQMRLSPEGRGALAFDAVGTNVIAVVVVLFAIQSGTAQATTEIFPYLTQIGVAVLVALGVGFAWRFVAHRWEGRRFLYIASTAWAIVVYAVAQGFLNGNGAVAAFVFGLMLAYRRPSDASERNARTNGLHLFQSEITFGLRTFFFVYLGLLVSFRDLTVSTFLASVLFTAAFLAGRAPSTALLGKVMKLARMERRVILASVARGMTDVVLVLLAIQSGVIPAAAQAFLLGVLPQTILVATLVCAVLLVWAGRAQETPTPAAASAPPLPVLRDPAPSGERQIVVPSPSQAATGVDKPSEPRGHP